MATRFLFWDKDTTSKNCFLEKNNPPDFFGGDLPGSLLTDPTEKQEESEFISSGSVISGDSTDSSWSNHHPHSLICKH